MNADNQRTTGAITSVKALTIIGRAMRYSFRYKFELAVKVTTRMTSIFWILLLPWPAKIVVDYIVLGDTAPAEGAIKPFFVLPLLALVENLTPYEAAWFMAALFLLMIFLIGAFGTEGAERDLATAGLAEGEDTATRSENEANTMDSLVSGMFGLFEALWHIRITHRLNHHLRSELFRRFAAHSVTDFHDRSVGDVVYRAMYDTPAISNVVFQLWAGPATSAINLTTTILLMFVVFRSEPAVVWCALAVAPINFVLVLYFANLTRKYGTLAREAGSETTAVIEESMSNVLAVQGLGSDDNTHARFAAASEFSYRRFRAVVLMGLLSRYTATVIGTGMVFVALWFVAPAFISGQYAPGDFLVIWGYYNAIAASSGYLGRLWMSIQENVTGLERVFTILDSPVEDLDSPVEAIEVAPESTRLGSDFRLQQGIRLSQVDFDYPDGTAALRGINFEGRLGEMIALTGPTGAGKSTLAYLVPGLLTPSRGQYHVDDHLLTSNDLTPLRQQVSLVFQETSVFDDTIAGNIRMGRLDASMAEIEKAADLAGVTEFIKEMPEGYNTRLGRAGGKLSVGQKQRIAIARALVSDKPVIILDEPTAALDPQTENQLVDNLRQAAEGHLVIVIAHRLSTIRSSDRIYFMHEGQIVESGTHDELMDHQGTYARFVQLQTNEEPESS
jgi:ABC-type multidrug transport system fused ATPase/permease subunit|tara:strand:- start:5083 stop:7101 length:2019 start_codon:yes stop_codon:yes gene_type:complete